MQWQQGEHYSHCVILSVGEEISEECQQKKCGVLKHRRLFNRNITQTPRLESTDMKKWCTVGLFLSLFFNRKHAKVHRESNRDWRCASGTGSHETQRKKVAQEGVFFFFFFSLSHQIRSKSGGTNTGIWPALFLCSILFSINTSSYPVKPKVTANTSTAKALIYKNVNVNVIIAYVRTLARYPPLSKLEKGVRPEHFLLHTTTTP